MQKRKNLKLISGLLMGTLLMGGCASTGSNKVAEGEPTEYDLYSQNKPESTLADTGIASGNLITMGIAKAYAQTIELEDKYKTSIENNKVASILEGIRLEQGEEAYKKAFSELGVEDKAEYNKFMESNVHELAVALEYATAAASMALGILSFNYQEYIYNPFAITKALTAITKATKQIAYTEQALEFMVETRSTYQAMLEYQGR